MGAGEAEAETKTSPRAIAAELADYIKNLTSRLASESNETRRFLRLLAGINTWLETRGLGRLVIVGGFAVELYAGRVYRTMDVDIVVEGEAAQVLEEALKILGERLGRGYLIPRQGLELKSIDIVSVTYSGRLPPVVVEADEGWVYVEAPEEVIVKYLAGWKYWESTEDRDKALWLYAAWKERLDHMALRRRAREESVEDKLRELEELYARLAPSS